MKRTVDSPPGVAAAAFFTGCFFTAGAFRVPFDGFTFTTFFAGGGAFALAGADLVSDGMLRLGKPSAGALAFAGAAFFTGCTFFGTGLGAGAFFAGFGFGASGSGASFF